MMVESMLTSFSFSLIQDAVREAPSAFNSQSSRIVILLGDEHDKYWSDIVTPDLEKVLDAESFERQKGRIAGFQAGYGTVVFFEDDAVIQGFQEKIPAYASMFPTWSGHGSGMAQIYVWSMIEAAGYGANLQHYGGITQSSLHQRYSLPPTWKAHSELVFGSVKAPAGEKTYVDDAERFKVFGAQ
jgi:predicted oxidoreductase (fatty acid repression mutant protein)